MMSGIWKASVVLVALAAIGCSGAAAANPTRTGAASETINYSNRMQESLRLITVNVSELGQLLTNPIPNDDAWHSEVKERFETLIEARDEVATIVPPPKLNEAHKSLMEALNLYAEGAELGLVGLEIGSGEVLILAGLKFEAAKSFIVLSTLQIKDSQKEPDPIPWR